MQDWYVLQIDDLYFFQLSSRRQFLHFKYIYCLELGTQLHDPIQSLTDMMGIGNTFHSSTLFLRD